jgi:major membrane immunogen (membrane-anchored lipoprotein)
MKYKLFAIFTLAVSSLLGATSAIAQDHSRGWEQGHIVNVSEVHIKDGMFNAYINDLNNVWRKFIEAQMEDGSVVSYGMYSNPDARDGEPDLYLTVTYANWAAYDRGVEYFEEIGEKILGGMEEMREANIDRGELRTLGSSYTLQEIKFAD